MLIELQQKTQTSCLFITHDLNLVRQLSHRIAVMKSGDLVDLFDTADAREVGRHLYTTQLLDAVPIPANLASGDKSA